MLIGGAVLAALQFLGLLGNLTLLASLEQKMTPETAEFVAKYGTFLVSGAGLLWLAAIRASRKWINPKPRLLVEHVALGSPVALATPFVLRVENDGEAEGEFEGQINRLDASQIFVPHVAPHVLWLSSLSKTKRLLPGHRDVVLLGGLEYKWDKEEGKHGFRMYMRYRNAVEPYDEKSASSKWHFYDGDESQINAPSLDIEVVLSSSPPMENGPLRKKYRILPGAIYETTRPWHRLHASYSIWRRRSPYEKGPIQVQVTVTGNPEDWQAKNED